MCPFCEDAAVREREIIRTKFSWAAPTNIPIVPMHTLVLPQRHVSSIDALSQEEHEDIWTLISKLKAVFREKFGAEGFNIAINEGEHAGQNVAHLHVHLLPRREGDTGITEYEPRKFLYRPGSRESTPEEELRAVAEEIRASLNG